MWGAVQKQRLGLWGGWRSKPRAELERALQRSDELSRLLADHSHDIIARLDLRGTIRYVSSAAQRMLGFGPDELVGEAMGGLVHPDELGAFQSMLQATQAAADVTSVQFRQRCRSGRYVWVELTARLGTGAPGAPAEIIASIRDIDQRRRSELLAAEATAKLRETNRLLTLAERLAQVDHWRFDVATGSFDCSPQVSVIVDIARDVVIEPTDILRLLHPADRRTLLRTLATARRKRAPIACDARLVLPDEMRHIRLVVQAERAAHGPLTGVFGVMRDVTEEEITQAELIRARDEARDAARAKSDFLATMSHEIRTPMTGVLGMIDLLRSDPAEEDRERYFDTLKQSADLLMAVLDDILDFSRIEAGKIAFEERDFDIEELMQSTLDLFDGAASQKGLLLSLSCRLTDPTGVRGDPVRVQQVVSNLLNNAIKFTNTGRVTVTLSHLSAAHVDERRRWRVEVSDTGIGIAPDKLGGLFDPFVQAEAATSRRFGGTGLGLSISRRLVKAMGGDLGVLSQPGKGATFWFELPLEPSTAAGDEDMAPAPTPSTRSLDLLVAEDNPVNQMIISATLRRLGHRATCVENGRLAVDLAAVRRFDCILMDMQMPEMDGLAATRAIRASDGPNAEVAIIALTADASSERRRFYDGAGLTDFLTKPIQRKVLADRLAAVADAMIPEPGGRGLDDDGAATGELFDLDRYNELRSILGGARVRGLLDLLVDELDRCPSRMRELIERGDFDGARAEAHSLKGAASNVGAIALGRIAAAIEEERNAGMFRAELATLDQQARRTVQAIAALR